MDVRIRNLDEATHSELKIIAIRQKCTLEELLIKILTEYVKRKEGE